LKHIFLLLTFLCHVTAAAAIFTATASVTAAVNGAQLPDHLPRYSLLYG